MKRAIDPLALLNVPALATRSAIQKAFQREAKRCHPDRGGTASAMRDLIEARRVLLIVADDQAPKPKRAVPHNHPRRIPADSDAWKAAHPDRYKGLPKRPDAPETKRYITPAAEDSREAIDYRHAIHVPSAGSDWLPLLKRDSDCAFH
ncbi:hypothetical protein BBC27_09500 [Acidithiobacillus ferrivorans]|uniref:J domain-containing protein n=1 Tax=Acidithiobacillus ferrivorans TaxID=160808 RepID=A0A1B9BZI7_9PROT|nr:J domain-containing protein [Acidithiobacillus ferrivorans]OCB03080.1 hypothetical protein BBC27_09500 [Acidithiobacillus ferrivorans]